MFLVNTVHPNYFEHPLIIAIFVVVIIGLLILDLGVFNKQPHIVTNKEAIIWSFVWIGLAMLFSLGIWHYFGFTEFADFQSAYWIEKSLSVDNLFVFIVIFKSFKVPQEYQHKVLFWGIIGAIILRAIFILTGVQLIHIAYLPATTFFGLLSNPVQINLVMLIFGVILIIAGIKSGFEKEDDLAEEKDLSQGFAAKIMHKLFRITPEYDKGNFFTVKNGVRYGTQLLLVVGIVEFTDLIFAMDSIPAIFAITDSPFILYTSNIFAILGLRSLFFILANFIHLFDYLKYGLSIILIFIGCKMLIGPWFEISSSTSLIVVGSLLTLSIVASLVLKPKHDS